MIVGSMNLSGDFEEPIFPKSAHGFDVVRHHSNKQAIEDQYFTEVQRLMADHLDNVDVVYLFN